MACFHAHAGTRQNSCDLDIAVEIQQLRLLKLYTQNVDGFLFMPANERNRSVTDLLPGKILKLDLKPTVTKNLKWSEMESGKTFMGSGCSFSASCTSWHLF